MLEQAFSAVQGNSWRSNPTTVCQFCNAGAAEQVEHLPVVSMGTVGKLLHTTIVVKAGASKDVVNIVFAQH